MIGPMEMEFIVTGIVILLLGTGLGILGEWIFSKEHEKNERQNAGDCSKQEDKKNG